MELDDSRIGPLRRQRGDELCLPTEILRSEGIWYEAASYRVGLCLLESRDPKKLFSLATTALWLYYRYINGYKGWAKPTNGS